MSLVVIIGAGTLGGSLAHTLAVRDRMGEVRLIDAEAGIAEGKALDILQSAPVERFGTRVSASPSILSAVGADVIVVADMANGRGEYADEAGLGLLRQLAAVEALAPIVFAGASQAGLMRLAATELRIRAARLVGSAPFALESALRALVALAVDGSAVEVSLRVVGMPPKRAVIAWEEATAFGQPLASELAPHVMAGINARIGGLWPPGHFALASAAASVVEAIADGGRGRFSCFADVGRGRIAAMPIEVSPDGIRRVHQPVLTQQERTLFETALEAFTDLNLSS